MIDLNRNMPHPSSAGRGLEAENRNDPNVSPGFCAVNGVDLFTALFDGCQGFINIRAIRSGEPTRSEFYPIEDFKWLPDVIDKYCEYNLYFGVGTRKHGNGKKEGIIHIPAVWADIDFKTTPRSKADKLISDLPLKPSVIIESGGGYHLYWFLKEPVGVEDTPMVENINKRLASFLEGDINVCDASHILRIPGTLNHKYNPARLVVVKEFTGTRYNLEDFEFLPEAQEKRDDEYVGKGPVKEELLECNFIRWCNDRPGEVSEPLWYAMVSNVARVSPGGPQFVHELSRGYPGYSKKETDQKILHALNSSGPHTCKYIKENGFDCSKNCTVKSPINLLMSSSSAQAKEPGAPAASSDSSVETRTPWQKARALFPKRSFPWQVIPGTIAGSLQQLARSCATSVVALPGASFAILASVLGASVAVAPKSSWHEPLIFWMADIRPSGDGKTPSARALCRVLYEAQKKADAEYRREHEEWESTPKKNRGPEPKRARGYFITDLTLEGLRDDISGHGGTVAVLDEISSFLGAQNQYKSKGTDRESWLALHDGNPIRVVRSSKTHTVTGARVSVFGGVQPEVWRKFFGGDDGLYTFDGTVFRFLTTYEGSRFYELTEESWTEENRLAWERTLTAAMQWADEHISSPGWKTKNLCLDEEARQYFFDWRNDLYGYKADLPGLLQGFIPKIVGYALRLSGMLYCMDRFSRGLIPGTVLTCDDIKKGIEASLFYLGHIVHAAEALCAKEINTEAEINEQVAHLARTLESLKPELDSGRLAVGYIQERFNQDCKPEIRITSARAMGAFLRSCGLTILTGRYRCNSKVGAHCLAWDEKTETLLKNVQQVHYVHKDSVHEGSDMLNIESKRSTPSTNETDLLNIVNMQEPMFTPTEHGTDKVCEHVEHSDHCSEQNKTIGAVEPVREGSRVIF